MIWCYLRSSRPGGRVVSQKPVVQRCSVKKLKETCPSLFFNKVAGLNLQLYYKRDPGTVVFLRTL